MYLGIDPGVASCGVAVLDGDCKLVRVGVYTSKKEKEVGDTQRRVAELLDWFGAFVRAIEGKIEAIAIEWPTGATTRSHGNAHSLGMAIAGAGSVWGHLHGLAHHVTSLIYTPTVTQWRRAMGAYKRGDEQALHHRLELTYEVIRQVGKLRAPHALDATGLALFAHQRVSALRSIRAVP